MMRSKFFTVVAAAAVLAALAEPSASAARSTGAGSEKTIACSGGTVLTAVSAHRLPAGSTAYTYNLPDGTSFESIAPPTGFNPATASSTLLTELNLPQRPAGAAARKAWDAQAAPFSKSTITGAAQFCDNTSIAEPTAVNAPPKSTPVEQTAASVTPSATSVGHSGTVSFSGYELRSGPYEKVVGHFKQPGANINRGTVSEWIGLNGTTKGGNDRLIQAGMDTLGRPFWELYCSGGSSSGCNSAMNGAPVGKAGDDVSVSVSFNPATLLSYYAVSVNGTQVVNIQYKMKAGSHSGDVADFMTERPPGFSAIPLAINVVFSGSRTYTVWNSNTSVPFGSQKVFSEEMINNTTSGAYYPAPCSTSPLLLMYPNDITSGGFTNNVCFANL